MKLIKDYYSTPKGTEITLYKTRDGKQYKVFNNKIKMYFALFNEQQKKEYIR